MKKLILFVLCALSGLMVSAQSRWGITPEGGFAAVNRVGMGSSWRAGVKVGVGVSYQFEPGWIGLKSGLYYANRGYSLGDYPRTTESATYVLKEMMTGGITQHFLQLPVMADFSWKVSKEVRMHFAVGMYAGVSVKNDTNWGSSFTMGYSKEPQALGLEPASEPASAVPADESAAVVVAEADPAKPPRGGRRPRRAEAAPDLAVGDVVVESGAADKAEAPTAKVVTRAPRSRKPKAVSE